MTKRLQPIRLDAYKPLSEVVSETRCEQNSYPRSYSQTRT